MAGSTVPPSLVLRLYIAGETPNSLLALANLRTLLKGHPHDLEIIDVLAAPERALDDGVFVTPTLVRLSPEPQHSIVGSLTPQHTSLSALMTP